MAAAAELWAADCEGSVLPQLLMGVALSQMGDSGGGGGKKDWLTGLTFGASPEQANPGTIFFNNMMAQRQSQRDWQRKIAEQQMKQQGELEKVAFQGAINQDQERVKAGRSIAEAAMAEDPNLMADPAFVEAWNTGDPSALLLSGKVTPSIAQFKKSLAKNLVSELHSGNASISDLDPMQLMVLHEEGLMPAPKTQYEAERLEQTQLEHYQNMLMKQATLESENAFKSANLGLRQAELGQRYSAQRDASMFRQQQQSDLNAYRMLTYDQAERKFEEGIRQFNENLKKGNNKDTSIEFFTSLSDPTAKQYRVAKDNKDIVMFPKDGKGYVIKYESTKDPTSPFADDGKPGGYVQIPVEEYIMQMDARNAPVTSQADKQGIIRRFINSMTPQRSMPKTMLPQVPQQPQPSAGASLMVPGQVENTGVVPMEDLSYLMNDPSLQPPASPYDVY